MTVVVGFVVVVTLRAVVAAVVAAAVELRALVSDQVPLTDVPPRVEALVVSVPEPCTA